MGSNSQMIYTAPQEFLMVKLKIALFGGLLITFPYFCLEIYSFISPGLYKKEKIAMAPYFIFSPILFLIGAVTVQFFIMPLALNFFSDMQIKDSDSISVLMMPKVSEYLNLITSLIIAFGLCFQLPVLLSLLLSLIHISEPTRQSLLSYSFLFLYLILFSSIIIGFCLFVQLPVLLSLLARVGFITSAYLKKGRKYAIVLVFLVAAFLTPPDLVSQIGLAIPTLILYEISILIVSMIEKKNNNDE